MGWGSWVDGLAAGQVVDCASWVAGLNGTLRFSVFSVFLRLRAFFRILAFNCILISVYLPGRVAKNVVSLYGVRDSSISHFCL